MSKQILNDLAKVILWGTQGYPPERSEVEGAGEGEDSSPEVTTNHEDESRAGRLWKAQIANYESRMKNPDTKHVELDGKIIFPSDSHQYTIAKPKFQASSVAACNDTTFCENPAYYPTDFIKDVIKNRQDLKFLATVDTVPEIGQRIDGEDGGQLCAYEDIVVFPKTAQNKADQWLFVINDDEFPQGVRIERCMTDNTACGIIDGLVTGYETYCKQKFIHRQLAAVMSNGSVGSDLFRFPASCCCHIKFTGNVGTRIGADGDKPTSRNGKRG